MWRLKVKDAITQGGTAGCGMDEHGSFVLKFGLDLLHTVTRPAQQAEV